MAVTRRRWRYYRTSAGRSPVREVLASLDDGDVAAIAAAMRDVADDGLVAARHVRGDIYEVRASGERQSFRVLFAAEGSRRHVLLALEAFSKKTQRTPPPRIAVAEARLADWRSRGRLSH